MTFDASQIRRSRRIQDKASSQPVQSDDVIYGDQFEEEEDSREEEDSAYEAASTPKKRKQSQKASSQPKKKAKTKEDEFASQRDEFEEHYLFQALNDAEVSVVELATEWVDLYKNEKDVAKRDLINFLLNAVGCFTKIEEHDVSNNESASETVGEIQTFFKRQKMHEFFIQSKKPEFKHLKKNFIQFITQLVLVSDEKGLLYESILVDDEEDEQDEETNIIEDMLIWLSSFSVCSLRALRYISTLSLLTIESALCRTLSKNNIALEKFKKQLSLEEAKKQSAAVKKRVTQMQSTVDDYTTQSSILENFIEDVVNTTFIHRFKDVDHYIRVEAMSALGEWMEVTPQIFYNVKYLKYLGWVLSDESSSVRLQVLKTLIRLLKHNTVVAGVRQFFERFKDRIVEMALVDVDVWVKTNAITLLTEINKLGFLDEEEVSKLSSLIFESDEKKIIPLVASFIKSVQEERASEELEAHASALEIDQADFALDLPELIRLRKLVNILQEAHIEHSSAENDLLKTSLQISDFAKAGKIFADLKGFDFRTLATAIDFCLLDITSIKVMDNDLYKLLQLTASEKSVLLGLIHGFSLELRTKEDKRAEFTPKILSTLPPLLKKSESNTRDLSEFIQMFALYPLSLFEEQNDADTYKSMFQSLIKYFKNNNIIPLTAEFAYLIHLLSIAPTSTTGSEIHTMFRDLLSELRIEATNFLTSDDFEFTKEFMEQFYEDYMFKIRFLGHCYDITGILKLFETIRQQILLTLTDNDLTDEKTGLAVCSVFEVCASATLYKLDFLLKSNELYDLEKELKVVAELLDESRDILVNKEVPLGIRSGVATALMMAYKGLIMFFREYESSEKTNLSNANRFREMTLDGFKLPESVTEGLVDIFLRNEAIYASTIDVMLEREDNEDIEYNSITADVEGIDEDEKAKVQWEAEKSLCVFAAKLLMFAKFGMLSEEFVQRIRLNAGSLGEMFAQIVEDLESDENEVAQPPAVERWTATTHATNSGNDPETVIDVEDPVEDDVPMVDVE